MKNAEVPREGSTGVGTTRAPPMVVVVVVVLMVRGEAEDGDHMNGTQC